MICRSLCTGKSCADSTRGLNQPAPVAFAAHSCHRQGTDGARCHVARCSTATGSQLELPSWVDPHSRRLTIARLSAVSIADVCQSSSACNPSNASTSSTVPEFGRRTVFAMMGGAALQACTSQPARAEAAAQLESAACTITPEPGCATPSSSSSSSSSTSTVPGGQTFRNERQGYALVVPGVWDKKDKMGADVLWEDPNRRSTSVGVTVNPVRVVSIDAFGTLDVVGSRLIDTEKKKESTLGVTLVKQYVKTSAGSTGALLYCYEYELDSTRGLKRIFNTVTIYDSRLYILNANLKCEKKGEDGSGGCDAGEGPATLALLRAIADSFEVLPVGK